MNASKILETRKAVISLTLQLVTPQATQDSKIWKSSFFSQFQESFALKILDMCKRGVIYPKQKVKWPQDLNRIEN